MPSSGYTALTFVADELLTSTKMNMMAANDASFNNGNGFNDGILVTRHFGAAQITADKVDLSAQPAWITPTLVNGWADYGSGFSPIRYMKDSMGFVRIRGMVKSGTINATMFTLPVGYRPVGTSMFVGMSGGGAVRIDITATGAVATVGGAAGTQSFTSLENIVFKAEN